MTQSQGPDPQKIRSMFGSIAGSYDRANQILSGGVHHLWRTSLVKWSQVKMGASVLDCATGTGDLAIAFKKAVGSSGRVIASDFSPEMLSFAPAKAHAEGLEISFEVADVTALPYKNDEFDISAIAFGIRNVADRKKAIAELARVVKPGGRVMVLEFGQPKSPLFRSFFVFYSQKILPRLGGWITGRPEAYSYLEESSAAFPCREDFLELMKSTGAFSECEYRSLTGGIAYLYRGRKSAI